MTMTQPIVSLSDVGKRYVKYDDVPTLISGVLRRRRRHRRSTLWAVRHVNLDVQPGEAVGVIGRNGAGKSTMLAMLAGVTAPTEGVVAVRGRVAPLLRLGVGFHDELTGRENVYINGTILGLKEQEIDRRFDDIVAFAELEEFIDTPVKFYSSGMQARLGFSVAVASQPDVLLVDEVLAVGDVAFQVRSFDRMLELQREGTTILVVSHNIESIRRVCSRVLVLNKGEMYYEGLTDEAIGRYHELMRVTWDEATHEVDADASPVSTNPALEIVGYELFNDHGNSSSNFDTRTTMTVRLHIRFRETVTDPIAGLWISNQESTLVYANSCYDLATGVFEAGSEAQFDIRIDLHLVAGTYTIGSWVGWGGLERLTHVRAPARLFYVVAKGRKGVANLAARYEVREIAAERPTAPPATDSREAASDPRAL